MKPAANSLKVLSLDLLQYTKELIRYLGLARHTHPLKEYAYIVRDLVQCVEESKLKIQQQRSADVAADVDNFALDSLDYTNDPDEIFKRLLLAREAEVAGRIYIARAKARNLFEPDIE